MRSSLLLIELQSSECQCARPQVTNDDLFQPVWKILSFKFPSFPAAAEGQVIHFWEK